MPPHGIFLLYPTNDRSVDMMSIHLDVSEIVEVSDQWIPDAIRVMKSGNIFTSAGNFIDVISPRGWVRFVLLYSAPICSLEVVVSGLLKELRIVCRLRKLNRLPNLVD